LKAFVAGAFEDTQIFFLPVQLALEAEPKVVSTVSERSIVKSLVQLRSKEPSLNFQLERAMEAATDFL